MMDEDLLRMMIRPFGLIVLPPVLWAALVQAATIGFLVAVTSNVGTASKQAYSLKPYRGGLCFLSAIVGSLLGVPAGGRLGDSIDHTGIAGPSARAFVSHGYAGLDNDCSLSDDDSKLSTTQATNVCLIYVTVPS
ncbi:hypothetical protein HRG_014930 [Hirsutella rhossiliensis]